jgi:EmrB/QacA subfamily drug resistance transporter
VPESSGRSAASQLNASPPVDLAPTTASTHKGLALAVIAIAQLMVVLDVSIVNVALPSIQTALKLSPTSLEWVVNAYALAFGGLLLLGGRIADMWGQRRTLIAGLVVLTAASLFGGMATGQAWLLTARTAQGVAGALVAPSALALLAGTFAEGSERNRAMGIYAAVSGAGGALGNVLGGVFTDQLSWRWVLFVNVPIGLFSLLAAPRAFRESQRNRGQLDLAGALSATAGMTLLVYGFIHAASHTWGETGTIVPLIAGGLILVAFVLIEARSRSALMPLRLFANRNRSGAYAIMLTLGAALIAVFYFLTLFMQIVLAYSPLKTGFTFLTFAVGAGVMSGVCGKVLDRTGPRPVLLVGTLLSAASLFWLSRLSPTGGYTSDLLGPLLLFGGGVGLCFVPLTLSAVAGVRDEESGVSSALLNTGQQVGGALGLAVLGTIAATATKNRVTSLLGSAAAQQMNNHSASEAGSMPPQLKHAIFDSLTHGWSIAFLVGGFVLVGACLIAAAVIRVSAEEAAASKNAGVVI